MPQLNLSFLDIPIPETHLWEQFDDAQANTYLDRARRKPYELPEKI